MFAHNTQFDFKMLNGFKELLNRGWELKSQYVKNKTFILVFKKKLSIGKPITLHIWDTMNYVPKKLEEIGISVGFPKLSIDFDNVSDKELEVYCKRDTEIIFQFIKKLIEFLEVNNLSRLKATAGSLSFNIFRHKFYNPDNSENEKELIYIHDWKKAIKLERASYKGGISDCFKLGSYNNLYKLDINSMYSKTMKEEELPYKLIAYYHENHYENDIKRSHKELMKAYRLAIKENYGIIAKCTIKLGIDDAYILNKFNNSKSMFAYGKFKVSLCTPELEFVEKYGEIITIHEINIYRIRKIFNGFVEFFYDSKVHFKKIGNLINEQFCKLILNTQYGKWGQRQIDYHKVDIESKFIKEYHIVILLAIKKFKEKNPNFDFEKGIAYLGCFVKEGELYIINGHFFLLKQTLINSKDSLVAIPSFITSYSRMLLIKYLKTAERENVYYCDTDSLFVNKIGYQKLLRNGDIDEFKLGKLKIEGKGNATFYNPKFYDFNEVRKCKGVKKDSVILLENNEKVVYEVNLWQKFKSDLKLGYINEQIINTTTKTTNKIYDKGKIDEFNNVIPYSVKEIEILI